jgi:hypothetical protein
MLRICLLNGNLRISDRSKSNTLKHGMNCKNWIYKKKKLISLKKYNKKIKKKANLKNKKSNSMMSM